MDTPDHAQALRELEELHQAGKVTDEQYERHKAKLTKEAAKAKPKPTSNGCLWGVVGVSLLIAVLVFRGCSALLDGSGDGNQSQSGFTTLAKVQCRDSVKAQLKAPATADFSEETVTGFGPDGEYTVTGVVDAENSFGAQLRSSFSCRMTFSDGYPTGSVFVRID